MYKSSKMKMHKIVDKSQLKRTKSLIRDDDRGSREVQTQPPINIDIYIYYMIRAMISIYTLEAECEN